MTADGALRRAHLRTAVGVGGGLGLTSASLSSGFIWACGRPCTSPSETLLWAPGRQAPLVFLAALTAWWGYLLAHYAATGEFIDASGHYGGDSESAADGSGRPAGVAHSPGGHPVATSLSRVRSSVAATVPDSRLRRAGVVVGAGVLVAGMVVGVVYIRRGDHLMTNVGGVLFLGGYVVAHYAETGQLL